MQERKEHRPAEEFELFKLFEECSDWVWNQVQGWPKFSRETVGLQLVRAIDSVGANIVEGDGRFATADSIRFFVIARASAREARLWLRRALKRNLVDTKEGELYVEKITSGLKQLNLLINYRKAKESMPIVRETRATFNGEPGFFEDHV